MTSHREPRDDARSTESPADQRPAQPHRDDEHRTAFLSRMSHEFRTPLNAVIGFSRVLEKNAAGNQRPEDIELLQRVRASGEHLLRLVEGVLTQKSVHRGVLPVELTDTDVADLTARVVANHRHAAMSKGLRIRAILPQDVEPLQLDPGRFTQALRNIVENAVKFTVKGGVRVSLMADPITRKPIRLSVTDTGIGIPPAQLERIFEPFEQGDGSTRRAYDGAGLGLSLARQFCVAMGCTLTANSTVGRGSRFTIGFPR